MKVHRQLLRLVVLARSVKQIRESGFFFQRLRVIVADIAPTRSDYFPLKWDCFRDSIGRYQCFSNF